MNDETEIPVSTSVRSHVPNLGQSLDRSQINRQRLNISFDLLLRFEWERANAYKVLTLCPTERMKSSNERNRNGSVGILQTSRVGNLRE